MTEPTDAPEPRLLTAPQVAERLSVSRRYVYQLMNRGELAYIELPRTPGSAWSGRRVRESEVCAFMDRNEQPATSPAAAAP